MRKRFDLGDSKVIFFDQLADLAKTEFVRGQLKKGNVGLITSLRLKADPDQNFVVFNTHLFWNWKFPFVRLCQLIMTFEELNLFLQRQSPALDHHLIFCGDLNFSPNSETYQLLTSDRQGADWKALIETIEPFLPTAEHVDLFSAWKIPPTDEERRKEYEKRGLDPSKGLTVSAEELDDQQFIIQLLLPKFQSFPQLNSVYSDYRNLSPEDEQSCKDCFGWQGYQTEPVFTVFDGRYQGTSDYILFSPHESLSSSSTLSLITDDHQKAVTDLPLANVLRRNRSYLERTLLLKIAKAKEIRELGGALPNDHKPSDHLPIAVSFVIKSKD